MADLIFTGGGTGGHLYPALAVAEALKALAPRADILFVGTPDRLEARVVPEHGYRFEAIPASGLSRRPIAAAKALWQLAGAVWRARRLLKRERPRAVLGTGGYVSAPVLLAARLEGIPVVLQEQNVVPGKVNRWIAGFAHTVATSFPGSERYFPGQTLLLVGNPIREAALAIDPAEARRQLGLPVTGRLLLVTGGSQGAQSINSAVVGALPALLEQTDWQVLHVTGPEKLEQVQSQAGALAEHPRYHLLGYTEAMPQAIVASDMVISRAGATTLAELTAAGKPMLLVPYPYAGGHQRLNAEAIVEAGGGLEIADAALDPATLEAALLPLMADPARLAEMAAASRSLGRPAAARELAALLAGLALQAPDPVMTGK
ncbi:MAG: undecaprenyldiphospho-muramoylpentapeptide beta-N-acetylglucosaminyltransferase [Candidatus Sericytochromatia bacterium]